MTAVLLGGLFLATAAWSAKQVGAHVDVPKPTWTLSVRDLTGEVASGSRVTLFTDQGLAEPVKIGSASVVSSEATSQGVQVTINQIEMTEDFVPSQASLLRAGDGSPGTGPEGVVRGAQGTPIVEPLVLQGAVASVVAIIGVTITYWLVGRRRTSVNFFVDTDGEMRKVNWSTRREVIGATIVVIVATFLIAGFLGVIDGGLSQFFKIVGVLQD
ncbi:MAG: preprotein translocase subunit SecE [Planctomycetota bacterium]|nr:preprotein translocase subunit SecE [Planctomycetota bacterium]